MALELPRSSRDGGAAASVTSRRYCEGVFELATRPA